MHLEHALLQAEAWLLLSSDLILGSPWDAENLLLFQDKKASRKPLSGSPGKGAATRKLYTEGPQLWEHMLKNPELRTTGWGMAKGQGWSQTPLR